MRRPMRKPHYLELGDVINYKGIVNFNISQNGANYEALNGLTGKVDIRNSDFATVLQYAGDNLPTWIPGDNEGGGNIYLNFTKAELSQKVTFSGPVHLFGRQRSYATEIKLADGADCDMLEFCADVNAAHVSMAHLLLDGNKANQGGGNAMIEFSGGYPVMRDCYVMFGYDKGILNAGQDTNFTNVYVEFCDGNGYTLGDGQNIWLINCTAWANGAMGVIGNTSRGGLTNCRIMMNGDIGVYMYNCDYFQIIGNHIALNEEEGVVFNNANSSIIANNIILDNSRKADNGYSSVRMLDTDKTIVTGNQILGTALDAIDPKYNVEETGTSDYTLLVNNILTGAQTGEQNVDAANSVVADNIEI